jgi:Tfp pilus assembly protein PilN
MTSCTIDWNDERNAKIEELETRIQYLQQENTVLMNEQTEILELNKNLTSS